MKFRIAASLIALIGLIGLIASPAALAQSFQDEWWTPGFSARVKLAPCDDKLCGTIVWAWDEQPSGASDKRPLVGQRIISGMKLDAAPTSRPAAEKSAPQAAAYAAVYFGSIYNPEDSQTYKATMRLKSPNTLLVEGCVLFICREQVWRRHDSLKTPPVSVGP